MYTNKIQENLSAFARVKKGSSVVVYRNQLHNIYSYMDPREVKGGSAEKQPPGSELETPTNSLTNPMLTDMYQVRLGCDLVSYGNIAY